MTWSRNCHVRLPSTPLGCKEFQWEDGNITVVECLCDTELCNQKIDFTTTTTQPTTTEGNSSPCKPLICIWKYYTDPSSNLPINHLIILHSFSDPNTLKCYYCREESEEQCNSYEYGEVVSCQMENDEGPHYGDACTVGHEGIHVLLSVWFHKQISIILFFTFNLELRSIYLLL